jgi:hypothetical protein
MAEIDDVVNNEIARQVAAISACTPGWAHADQVRFLRLFVETGLEELERAEDDYFDLLVSCLHFAGSNMQDARLGALESQVAQLKNPPVLLGDLLTTAAIVLAGELAIVYGAHVAIPALFAVLGVKAAARSARQTLGRAAVTEQTTMTRLRILMDKAARNADEVQQLELALAAGGSHAELGPRLEQLYRLRQIMRDDEVHVRAALQTNLDTANKAAAVLDGAPSQLSQQWQAFLDNPAGEALVGRIGEEFGPAVAAVVAKVEAAGEAGFAAFETSAAMGVLLSQIERERMDARCEWAQLRLFVRFLRDDNFLTSGYVQALLRRIHATRPQLAQFQAFVPTVRGPLVNGLELFLWFTWFAHNEMLGVRSTSLVRRSLLMEGQIVDGIYVRSVTKAPRGGPEDPGSDYAGDGDFYPAIPKLSEDLAEYLYRKFARGFFIRRPSMLPGPLEFKEARYDEVPAMPRTSLGLVNLDRAERVDQMRLLVAIYFNNVDKQGAGAEAAGPVRKMINELLGIDPKDDPLRRFFKQETQRPFPEPLPGQLGPTASAAEALKGLLLDSGVDQMWLVGEARARLENAVTDLDLKITSYPLIFGPDAAAPPPGAPDADDALRDIDVAKGALTERHREFLELAADRPDLLDEVGTTYDQRIAALSDWAPEADAALAWRFPATAGGTPS